MNTINTQNRRRTMRWQLLSTVSAMALAASVCGTSEARAASSDTNRPLIWIDLGGQMDKVGGQGEIFAPSFLAANPTSPVLWNGVSPLEAQRSQKFAFGEEGKISFQPENSDWIFSAAIQIGRSGNARQIHHQTYNTFFISYKYGVHPINENPRGIDVFSDTHAQRSETHAILDFQAGTDVGLGMFGGNASSTLSLGVRFAQFMSKQDFAIRARPSLQFQDLSFPTFHLSLHFPYFHTYHSTGHAERSFHGVGPSLSWTGSAPFAGNLQDGELTVDWGANAALLFGRQRAQVQHLETAHYVHQHWVFYGGYYTLYPPHPGGHDNIRNVTVPNVGGSFGMSWRVQNFKLSFGYHADFFFGAMDTGVDAVKKSNLTFNGPYASISIGLGD